MKSEDPKISDIPPIPPVSSFTGPVAELINHGLLSPPGRPGLLATLDRFEILRILGGGGMGVVLLARDGDTGRESAIKLVRPELVTDTQIIHRFVKEAGHLQKLRHPNVLPVLEISERPQGPYFVMPYFSQGSLARRIVPGQPIEPESALDIALQIADGLEFAHRRGIIHRDLKPANILLGENGKACLADFGLARSLFNDTLVDVERQQAEGTAPYMSPGVAAGHAEDTRCDIYAFGALLYEMTTGEPPYSGHTAREIRGKILAGPPKSAALLNPKIDGGIAEVIAGAMARELRDRYADMADVRLDLQRIKDGKKPAGARGGFTASLPLTRGRQVSAAVWVPVCVAGAALLGFTLFPSEELHTSRKSRRYHPPVAVNPEPIPLPVTWTVTTLAGLAGQPGSLDGPAGAARFSAPFGLAVDYADNVFVADTGNSVIRKLSPAGVVTTFAGTAGKHGRLDGTDGAARFNGPFGIAEDGAGTLFVADTPNNSIRKISPDGMVSTFAGLTGNPGSADGGGTNAQFRNPWGVAADSAGNVYVADVHNFTIRKINAAGNVSTLAGNPGKSGSANGIGGAARFNCPFGVAVDQDGVVYVADTFNHAIRKIAKNGLVTTLAGRAGQHGSTDGAGENARFWNPHGLVVDDDDKSIYVADTDNFLIRRVSASGVVTTIAGQADSGSGAADGVGREARFSHLGNLALDSLGNLYVADTDNHTIRKVTRGAATHAAQAKAQAEPANSPDTKR